MFFISRTMSGSGLLGPFGFPNAVVALEELDDDPLEDPFFESGFPHQSVPLLSHSA